MGMVGAAELQDHLRVTRQTQAFGNQPPGWRRLERLGVQAREDPFAGRVQEQPLQGLTGSEPVDAAVTAGEKNRGGGRPASGDVEPDPPAEVEIALPEPPRLGGRTGRKRVPGYAITPGSGLRMAPAQEVRPGGRITIFRRTGRREQAR